MAKLCKDTHNKVLFGVCGGLGKHFNIDPTIVRVIFIVLSLCVGVGLLTYLILALVMPKN